ncbi:cysteine desulfurase family protein [Amycolatopsis sp., V23-08]|uniref:Cysteine desulfurase family protein n=1 Tax=Amycolatopsis heterodermiae TaxID=3110235 RepID=A0ABU5RPG3_9PSEU|nr:cysteine desulfurase family protein [Amycolatopsis sp., V23-08]MEA5367844.1 cysteine desulfurase family protein [Amycolatopsis sp., V23-08]
MQEGTVSCGPVPGPVYLDHNATTPVEPDVVAAMLPFLGGEFGNPSSSHSCGTRPRAALARAREQVAALIGGSAGDVVFTGSGSEADNLAVRGTVLVSGVERPHLITQRTEHPAVLLSCRALERLHHADVTYLPVDENGLVDPADLAAAFTERTVLVSIMLANNETGALQPVRELAGLARARGVPFHCDAAQAVGRIPVSVDDLGADLLTVVGHKMYAPKGVGALYRRPGVRLEPLVLGGGQEHGLRAGTENVALAVALGAAAELVAGDLSDGVPDRTRELRDRLHARLDVGLPGRVALNGPSGARLPNTLNVSIDATNGHELLTAVPELAASTGSACHSGSYEPSPVLTAMGFDAARSLAALRLSLGRGTTAEDIARAADLLVARAGG